MEQKQLIEATCPECRGPLSEVTCDPQVHEYQCLVGHKYSARSLLEAHSETQEKTLWAAVLALEESANMVSAVSGNFPTGTAARLRQQADRKLEQAAEIRKILEALEPFAIE